MSNTATTTVPVKRQEEEPKPSLLNQTTGAKPKSSGKNENTAPAPVPVKRQEEEPKPSLSNQITGAKPKSSGKNENTAPAPVPVKRQEEEPKPSLSNQTTGAKPKSSGKNENTAPAPVPVKRQEEEPKPSLSNQTTGAKPKSSGSKGLGPLEQKNEKQAAQPSVDYIDYMVAMPLQILPRHGKRIRVMPLHVLLDEVLWAGEAKHLKCLNTLIHCMQRLQRFDPNLTFGVSFYFKNKGIFLDGQEAACQSFAKTVFHNLIEKYIGARNPKDGSPELNLISATYYHEQLQKIVLEWVDKAVPLISLESIVNQLIQEESAEAEQKLQELIEKCAIYGDPENGGDPVRCEYTPLLRFLEVVDGYESNKGSFNHVPDDRFQFFSISAL